MKKRATRKRRKKPKRTKEEMIHLLWLAIDEAHERINDEMTTSEEKRLWTKNMCDTMGVLNKIMATGRQSTMEEEDLGSLLLKVPRRIQRTIVRRVRKWRRPSLYNA
jgi:hypothetical protein